MAAHTGTTGTIAMSHTVGPAEIKPLLTSAWSFTETLDVADATAFSPANNMRTKLAGVSRATGTASGFLDNTTPIDEIKYWETPATVGDDIDFTLTSAATGIDFTFSGWITSFSANVEVGQPVSWTLSFKACTAPGMA